MAAGKDPSDPAALTDERVVSLVRDRLLAELGKGLDFTASDLAANRTGQLTPREQAKLRSSAAIGFGCATVCGVGGGLFALIWASQALVPTLIIGALAALFATILVVISLRQRLDAADPALRGRSRQPEQITLSGYLVSSKRRLG